MCLILFLFKTELVYFSFDKQIITLFSNKTENLDFFLIIQNVKIKRSIVKR